jgi:hypothetical protein
MAPSGARGTQQLASFTLNGGGMAQTQRPLLLPQVALHASPSPASTMGHARTTFAPTPAPAPLATRAGTARWVRPHPPPTSALPGK